MARRIEELAGAHPRYGYRRIWALLDREGWSVNKKAVRRIWRQSGLKLAQPQAVPKPRRPHGQDRNACHLRPSRGKDDVWTWDFIFDRTSDGRSLKWLSLVDEYTRECLALEARRGMTAEDIRIILAEVAAGRGGPPCRLRSDNGPEFVAQVVRSWLEGTGSGPLYVAPGSPWQNGYAESFHSCEPTTHRFVRRAFHPTPHHPLECRPEPTPSTPARGGSGLHCRSGASRASSTGGRWSGSAARVLPPICEVSRVVTGTDAGNGGTGANECPSVANSNCLCHQSKRCAVGPRRQKRSDALSEKTKRCAVGSHHSKVRDEFLDREEFESEPQARALGALEGGV